MDGPARRLVRREAAGVVVAITPWNAPVQTNPQKIVPALAAGCAVVLKASHDTPWSATMLGRVAAQCPDLAPGELNILTSSGDAALGAMLTGDLPCRARTSSGHGRCLLVMVSGGEHCLVKRNSPASARPMQIQRRSTIGNFLVGGG